MGGEASLSGPNFQDGRRVSRRKKKKKGKGKEKEKEGRKKNVRRMYTHTHTCTYTFGGLLIGKVALNAR